MAFTTLEEYLEAERIKTESINEEIRAYRKQEMEKRMMKKAGEERTIYSDPDGIDLFDKPRRYPEKIHDDSYVLGWNRKI